MGYGFSTEDGFESYSYNWGQIKLDGTKPLSILNHVGGSPIAYVAFRNTADIKAYEFSSKWCGKLIEYAERIAVPFLEPEQRELFAKVKAAMMPLGKRLDAANREKLIPAFADGQSAIVMDAKLTGDNWVALMPPAVKPLPLPEISCVYGVSDAKLMKEGYREYFDVLQTAITELSAIMPEQVPPFQLPPPQTQVSDAGTVYYYPLPAVAGVDERIAPNAGVSNDAMVLSLVPDASKRLLASQPLSSRYGTAFDRSSAGDGFRIQYGRFCRDGAAMGRLRIFDRRE